MIESGYYPPGAEFDSNAPYNSSEPPKREFEVTASQTLSRNVTVKTDEYVLEEDWDDDLGRCDSCNTDDTDWKKIYENQHETIPSLLSEFKEMLEAKIEECENFEPHNKKYIAHLKYLSQECEDWCVDDFEVIQ